MKCALLTSALAFVLFSCSSTLKVNAPDPKTGYLPTDSKVDKSEVLVDKPIDLSKYNNFLYIRKSKVNMDKYETYIIGDLKNIGGFDKFYTETELEQYVIQNHLTDKVTSISDNIGLNNLQKQVGNFLVCETTAQNLGGYNYLFDFKITNPANAEVLLEIKHKGFNFSGLDRPLFNPVFNYYIEWMTRNSPSPPQPHGN
jgi:hypothetical protein